MKRTHLPSNLHDILAKVSYATIASTCADGHPWNTPVYACFDDDLAMYWVSHTDSQHSKNIASEPRIFVVVYDSTVPEGEGLGIYFKMKAKLLTSAADIRRAKKIYDTSFFKHDFSEHDQFLADCPQGFYKAVPEQIWRNSDTTIDQHFIDARSEVSTVLV